MLPQTRHLRFLSGQLLLVLILFSVSRVLFYLFNAEYFSGSGISTVPASVFWGLRFDSCAILMLNGLYILLFLLPFQYRDHSVFVRISSVFFIVVNALALLTECIDWAFFRFARKRLTADFFDMLGMGNDVQTLLPVYLKQYWFILLAWFVFIFFLVYITKQNIRKFIGKREEKVRYGLQTLYFFLAGGMVAIGMRGGIQLRPIEVSTAIKYTTARNIPLFTNSTFSILKSWQKKGIDAVEFMDEKELSKYYNTRHKASPLPFKAKNVVVLILESFSKEYIGFLNDGKGYTPFLDSLMKESLVFPNAFANAKRSIEGIPAVVAGMPAWMEQPYISSIYQSNEISTLANLLKEKGYHTSFYHGGANGTMNFDSFSRIAGFEAYVGKTEYNNNSDYDGHWGIYDEPFLQYFASNLNKQRSPFLATLFTLSSHHPYSIPSQYANKFSKGTLEIHESIGYTDHALKQFFTTASHMSWFNNTIFVITADHTSLSNNDFYSNRLGSYEVPLFYFIPSGKASLNQTITQQIDILPTVMGLLHYDADYFAFGNDALDSSSSHFAFNLINNSYEYVEERQCTEFDGNSISAEYDLKTDSLLQHPLPKTNPAIENKIKAIVQTYNAAIINNRLK